MRALQDDALLTHQHDTLDHLHSLLCVTNTRNSENDTNGNLWLYVINLWLTSSISGLRRQPLTIYASSISGLRRQSLAVLDQSLVARHQSPTARHQSLAVRHQSLNHWIFVEGASLFGVLDVKPH